MSFKSCLAPVLAAVLGLGAASTQAAEFRVLVVMSYEEDNPWVREIRQGIDAVLGASSEITYVHMDTKRDPAGGAKKAEEAHAIYQRLQPHGVIAADDDAQRLFVLPYLKERGGVPVMFNGVNAEPGQYGYPAANVSGVLERAHVHESLAFIKQVVPTVETACFLTNNVPAGAALKAQVDREKDGYPLKVRGFHLVASLAEWESMARTLNAGCDTLFVDSLEGILDAASRPMTNREVLSVLRKGYRGPILGGNRYQVEQGAWAAVVKTGQEQGELSGDMLLKAMRGTAVAQLPVTKNVKGQRVINVSAVESHKIALRPVVIRGASLVRQQD
ncbi:ABC transporter substrate-binding protein [Sphaerotilus microaerophilus]|nr:ABC transporter substrate binding protein [Sphaerotilus sp. FB-5]